MEIQQTIDLPQKLDTLREVMQSMAGGVEEQYAESTLIVLPVDYLKMEHTVIHAQLDSVASRVNAIAENSAGHIDVLSHIAIPLIIALFALRSRIFSLLSLGLMRNITQRQSVKCSRQAKPIDVICGGLLSALGILSFLVYYL